ncbi:hypothetical protein SM019_003454 [Cronobacter sakazakii]|nr:hypothetical protein [Cronobacter sakazakii]
MPATASNTGFVMLTNDILNIEKIAGKVFTGNMKITYSLIQGFERNGQTAYFSQSLLATQLGLTDRSVRNLLRDMVTMGLIIKTGQIGGKTCRYTVNPITPEMLGTVEAEAPPETPQRATVAPEEVQEANHAAEAVEALTVAEIKPTEEAEAPEPAAPITLLDVYSGRVETVDQTDPQTGEAVSVVTPYPRGEVKEPSREWDLDPAF